MIYEIWWHVPIFSVEDKVETDQEFEVSLDNMRPCLIKHKSPKQKKYTVMKICAGVSVSGDII